MRSTIDRLIDYIDRSNAIILGLDSWSLSPLSTLSLSLLFIASRESARRLAAARSLLGDLHLHRC
jgi:hypothetical protein